MKAPRPHPPARTVKASEVTHLLSFPKCGRTWVRLMLGVVIARHFELTGRVKPAEVLELTPLVKYHPRVPPVLVSHDDDPQWRKPEELGQSKRKYRQSKVIFLARDPRDVVVSVYFQMKKRLSVDPSVPRRREALKGVYSRMFPYEGDLASYIREDVGGFETIIHFYNIWAENRHVPRAFLLVEYEQLHQDALGVLRGICDFVGLPNVSDTTLEKAVAFTSFDNMRRLEATDAFRSFMLRPSDVHDDESYKVRKGKVGGYKEYLSQGDLEYVNRIMRQKLSPFYGYEAD